MHPRHAVIPGLLRGWILVERYTSVPHGGEILEERHLVDPVVVSHGEVRVQLKRLELDLEISLVRELRNDLLDTALRRPGPVSVRVGDDIHDDLWFRLVLGYRPRSCCRG